MSNQEKGSPDRFDDESKQERGEVEHAEHTQAEQPQLKRLLKARHIQMIAIGSSIGTGLFIGTGKILHTGGPLSIVLGFVLVSICLIIMMQALAEMSTVIPVSGSFSRYATRFVDPALGFAIGFQYWLAWTMAIATESSAFVLLIKYWDDSDKLIGLWVTIFLIICLSIHVAPVRVFGEVEFYISAVKVVAVIMFIIVTWSIMGGAGPKGQKHGGEYWRLPGLENGLANGFKGLASAFATAGFAAGGTEMVGVIAGESQHPKYNIPRATKTLVWRVVVFYVTATLFLTFVMPYDNKDLIGDTNANSSPFVLAIKSAGIKVLPDILNAVVILCVISVGSCSLYTASRVLKSMAEDGMFPKYLRRTDKAGRPYAALLTTAVVVIALSYVNLASTGSDVFTWFSSISGLAYFLSWSTAIVSNFRFRSAIKVQGSDLLSGRYAFTQKGYPYLPAFALIAFIFMIICQFYISVSPIDEPSSAAYFFENFLGVPIFIIMLIGYKLIRRTKIVPLAEIDLQTGRLPDDPEEIEKLEHYAQLTKWQRAKTYIHF